MRMLMRFKGEIEALLSDRDVALLLAVGTVALTLLFGGVYLNTYLDHIPTAILDEDNSQLSRKLVQAFEENDRFLVEFYPHSKEELQEVIESRKAAIGLHIPQHFQQDIKTGAASRALVLIDGTNLVVANNGYAAAATLIQTFSAAAEMSILQAKGSMPQTALNTASLFGFTERILYDPRLSYMNYLLIGFIAVFLQQVMLSGVGISVIKSGQAMAQKRVWSAMLARILACAVIACTSVFISLRAAHILFKIPMRGNIFLMVAFCLEFAAAVGCPAVIIASLLREKLRYVQFCYLLSLPTFVSCGYVWPMERMPWALRLPVRILWPLAWFARPLDEWMLKGALPLKDMLILAIYFCFWFPAAVFIFRKKSGAQIEKNGDCFIDSIKSSAYNETIK